MLLHVPPLHRARLGPPYWDASPVHASPSREAFVVIFFFFEQGLARGLVVSVWGRGKDIGKEMLDKTHSIVAPLGSRRVRGRDHGPETRSI